MSNNSKTLIRDFTEGSVIKQLIIFSSPLLLSNLLQVVYNMVDMIVVGKVMGKMGLSAVSIGGDITTFLTFLAIGFTNAGQVIIAQYIGADQNHKVGKFIGTMTTSLLLISVILSVVGIIIRNPILSWMNTPEQAWDEAMAYSVTCMAGLAFIYGYNIVSAILRGMGDAKHPFIFISIAAVMNIVLDILFVKYFNMGAFGAALATVIGQAFSFIYAVIFLVRNRNELGVEITKDCFIIDKDMFVTLIKLGVPMAIKNASVQLSKLFVSAWINAYGVTVSAVAGIGHKINSISNLVSTAVNTAGSSMVGQNIGAEKYKRVPKIMVTSFVMVLIMSLMFSIAVYLFPEQIFMLFTDDRSIMGVAMEYVPVAYLVFLGSAARAPMNALVNGSGNFKVNFAVAILDGIVMRIGLAVLLGFGLKMGYMGFWYGDAFAGFTPLVIGAVYYISGKWKTRKYVVGEVK